MRRCPLMRMLSVPARSPFSFSTASSFQEGSGDIPARSPAAPAEGGADAIVGGSNETISISGTTNYLSEIGDTTFSA
jgi:hypothetical protein